MADSGYVSFDVVSTGNNVRLTGRIHWQKCGSGAQFWASLTKAYSRADNSSKWVGNNLGKMRLAVDGTWTAYVNAAGARGAGSGASGSGGRENNDFADAATAKITKAAKASAYALTLENYGNGTATGSYSVTIQWALPIWMRNGSLNQIEKAYMRVGNEIKECSVYMRVGDVIKEIR